MIVTLAYDELRQAIADRASGGRGAAYESSFMAPEIVEMLLRSRPAGWFPDYDALLRKSLTSAIGQGVKLEGSRLARWDYGAYNQLTIESPVLGRLPLVGKYFK